MISDKTRADAYVQALKAAITPDSTVLDIGAGTGFFSIFACKLGARKVYAVEPNELVELARQFAAENGCDGRIEFISKLSTEIELEKKADVIVCDLRGALPLFESSIVSMMDARKRLAAPGCQLIPQTDEIFFVPCEAVEFYDRMISKPLDDAYGVNIKSGRRLVTNVLLHANDKNVDPLSQPVKFATLDYRTVEETNYAAEMSFTVERDGVANGLRGWFEADLGHGIKFDNSLANLETIYGAPFFPFHEPVQVTAGDRIDVNIRADYVKGDYNWCWDTKVTDSEGQPKAEFQQSFLLGAFQSPKKMLKASEFYVPKPNTDARVDAFILQRINGENLSGDIAEELQNSFTDRFATFEDALSRVNQLTERYSE